jgi:hypothetical protein
VEDPDVVGGEGRERAGSWMSREELSEERGYRHRDEHDGDGYAGEDGYGGYDDNDDGGYDGGQGGYDDDDDDDDVSLVPDGFLDAADREASNAARSAANLAREVSLASASPVAGDVVSEEISNWMERWPARLDTSVLELIVTGQPSTLGDGRGGGGDDAERENTEELRAYVPADDTLFVRDETSLLPQLDENASFFQDYNDQDYAALMKTQRRVHERLTRA